MAYASPLHPGVEVWLPGWEKATEGNDLMYQVQVMQMLSQEVTGVMGHPTEFVMRVLEEVVEVGP